MARGWRSRTAFYTETAAAAGARRVDGAAARERRHPHFVVGFGVAGVS
jgi:hypothetical protein